MDNLWILVAHRSGARFFRRNNRKEGIQLIEEVDFPAGRVKNQDVDSDRPGRHIRPGIGARVQKHGVYSEVQPDEQIALEFSKKLSSILDEGRTQNRFSNLMIAADPHMVGLLRQSLNKQTYERVVKFLGKNLAKVKDYEVPKYLSDALSQYDQDKRLSL
jgi:protein required for attachment to host cells